MEQTESNDRRRAVLERRLDNQLTKTINLIAWMERVATGKERMVLRDLPHPE